MNADIENAGPPPTADLLARILHNEGDGGIWEEFDWNTSVDVALVLGPVVDELVRIGMEKAWDEGRSACAAACRSHRNPYRTEAGR